jgi:vacuolar-type H+-ATPase subunit E/Vma4
MTYEEKKARFIAAVRAEAMKQSIQINSDTEAYIESELAKAEKELRFETEAELRSKMNRLSRETGLSISNAQREADAALHACRYEIEEAVFSRVKEKLAAFRTTDEYDAYLAQGAGQLNSLFFRGDNIKLYYAPQDEDRLKKIIPMIEANVEALPSDSIKLGGFRAECMEKKLAVDDTLDTALEQQRERFRAIPELRLDGALG